jgi:hypothetical protein
MKRIILEGIHWSIIVFLVLSAIIFAIEVSPLLNGDEVIVKDNHILFCENGHCIKLGEKIYWTFLEIFIVEIVIGGLALVVLRENISLKKRSDKEFNS